MTILDKIIAEKQIEVARLKEKQQTTVAPAKKINETFRENVLKKDTMSIIAEIKRASPSKGSINEAVDPVAQAKIYAANGASAISVLTDTPFFKGTFDDLRAVREVVDVPILCKDFMIDEVQIDYAYRAGANIILLIAAALNDEEMHRLYTYAKERDLEVLCEVHNEEEMERVLKLGANLIGINNRNLKTFEVELETTKRLASMVTNTDAILISESGLKEVDDVLYVAEAGARAILVGETFMRAENVAQTMTAFQVPLVNNISNR